jgi:anthranilate phosphoribosyltransferase
MLGVANLDQMRLYRQIYQQIGIQFGIVNSIDGYDEISLTSDFKVTTNESERIYSPSELGLSTYAQTQLYGGHTAAEAMAIFDAVLNGTSTEAQRDVVLINAAFAIHIIEPQKPLPECLAIARESLYSGKAQLTFQKFVKINS